MRTRDREHQNRDPSRPATAQEAQPQGAAATSRTPQAAARRAQGARRRHPPVPRRGDRRRRQNKPAADRVRPPRPRGLNGNVPSCLFLAGCWSVCALCNRGTLPLPHVLRVGPCRLTPGCSPNRTLRASGGTGGVPATDMARSTCGNRPGDPLGVGAPGTRAVCGTSGTPPAARRGICIFMRTPTAAIVGAFEGCNPDDVLVHRLSGKQRRPRRTARLVSESLAPTVADGTPERCPDHDQLGQEPPARRR